MRTKENEGFQDIFNHISQEFDELREIELLQTSNSVSAWSYRGVLIIKNIEYDEIKSIIPDLILLWYPVICERIFLETNKNKFDMDEENIVSRELYEKWLKDSEKKEKFGKKLMNTLEYIFKQYLIEKSPKSSTKEYAYAMNVDHPIWLEDIFDSIDCLIYNLFERYDRAYSMYPDISLNNRWLEEILNNNDMQQWIKFIIFLSRIRRPKLENKQIIGKLHIRTEENKFIERFSLKEFDRFGLDYPEFNEIYNLDNLLTNKIKIYGIFLDRMRKTWINKRILTIGNYDNHEEMTKSPSVILQQNVDLMNPHCNIQQLYIDKLKLKDITTDFSKMPELKILNLSSNPISNFPKGIEKLKNLLIIDLSKTNIEDFPSSDFKMESNPFIFFKQKFFYNNSSFFELSNAEINVLRKMVEHLCKNDYYSKISLDNKLIYRFKDKFDEISQLFNTPTARKFKNLQKELSKELPKDSKKQNTLDKFF